MWTVRNSIYATVHNENGDRIATVAPAPDETDRARLIAAAPDLLAALHQALPVLDAHRLASGGEGDLAALTARAAIARATGEAA